MKTIYYTADMAEAAMFERSLPPGDYSIKFKLTGPMTMSVDDLTGYLAQSGVRLYSVSLLGDTLEIKYNKPEVVYIGQWQLILPLIVPIVIAGTVIFGIIKIGDISSAIIPLVLILGGVAILVMVAAGREAVTAVAKRI